MAEESKLQELTATIKLGLMTKQLAKALSRVVELNKDNTKLQDQALFLEGRLATAESQLDEVMGELGVGDGWMDRAKDFEGDGGCLHCFRLGDQEHTEDCKLGILEQELKNKTAALERLMMGQTTIALVK